MKRTWFVVAVFSIALFCGTAQAQIDPAFEDAPTFSTQHWLQGTPTALKNTKTLYVVELWATWCGPCIASLPKLATLQERHAGAVRVIALTDDDRGAVRSFLKQNEFMASLAVVVHPRLFQEFSDRPEVQGIPTTFLIQGGKILWIGHPGAMEPVLTRALDGRWTPTSEKERRAYEGEARAYVAYWADGGTLTPEARRTGDLLVGQAMDHPMVANNVAWALLTRTTDKSRPLDLALSIAKAANEGSKGADYATLDTYARALYLHGERERAIALQTQSLALCKASDEYACAEIAEVLKLYQRGGTLR